MVNFFLESLVLNVIHFSIVYRRRPLEEAIVQPSEQTGNSTSGSIHKNLLYIGLYKHVVYFDSGMVYFKHTFIYTVVF